MVSVHRGIVAMNIKLARYMIMALIATVIFVSVAAHLYRSGYKEQKRINGDQTTEIQQLTDTLNDQNTHIDMLHEMDAKHLKELANAKSEIDTLRSDVAAGRRKLHIKATCPVSETTSSSSVVDAGTPQLTEAARQDYYDLLRMMAENERQTKYLQDYVNTECGRVK
ncbi:lysis protein [Xenorhabdus sp. XENO-1]|uniref:lysis protein n=1 Tax=Xenorhabdus bovienii TaxID=40576 RepID=UPI0020CA63E1|nr:lysis protein [Xenorhabdus bovienii]MCP9270118.1 lysis protein [Xenorhabdus bovienii subsp. africana]